MFKNWYVTTMLFLWTGYFAIILALVSGCTPAQNAELNRIEQAAIKAIHDNKPAILAGETTGVCALMQKGLDAWAAKDYRAAHTFALAAKGVLPSAQDEIAGKSVSLNDTVGSLLNAGVLANADPAFSAALAGGSGFLNAYAKIPVAKLSQDARDYGGAALSGMQKGIEAFLAEPATAPPTGGGPAAGAANGPV